MRTAPTLRTLLLLAILGSLAADWPRFRGPHGNGTSDDKDVPTKWSEPLWKKELPGTGHSSPVVWGDRIFVQSGTPRERLLICLDTSGKVLWNKSAPGKPGKTHRKNTLASSTPATDGERVYCVFWNGAGVSLYAYDFKGNLTWTRDLGSFTSQHGPGFSPVVHDGLVYVNNDQDGSAVLQAFDARSGKTAWQKTRLAFRACYSTPFINEQGTVGPELIVASTAGLTAYEPKTGKEVWNYSWHFDGMALRTVGSPVAGEGLVFATSGDGSGARAMIAVKLGGKGDVTKTNLVWDKDAATPYVPTVLLHQGHVYFVTDDGFAACVEARSGKEVWRQRLGPITVSASPLLINGNVYAISEKGDCYVFPASPAGFKLVAKSGIGSGETVQSSPAVANGRLYIRSSTALFCVGKK